MTQVPEAPSESADAGSHPPDGQPGSANSPASSGDEAAPRAADRVAPGAPPPAANQGKAETRADGVGIDRGSPDADRVGIPADGVGTGVVGARSPGAHFPAGLPEPVLVAEPPVRPSAPVSASPESAGTAFRSPGELGASPSPMDTDVAAGAGRTSPGHPDQSTDPAAPTPGDLHGVSAGAVEPAPGTSQDGAIVTGIKTPGPEAARG
jgi:hypothetical protein